jgi:integrase
MDVAGQEKRQRMREKICPISGPGKLSASERQRKAKEIIAASGADSVEHFEKVVKQNPVAPHGTTFREQAKIWLADMQARSKPAAPSTLATWESCLDKWLYPNIGDTPLASIKNLTLRNLVKVMKDGGLGASAQRAYTNVVKMVVASAVDEEGEALYPRKWNHKFIDLTPDDNPHRPWFTGDVVTRMLANTKKPKYRVLFALCAATGLRFGEALGIKIESISPDASIIKIQAQGLAESGPYIPQDEERQEGNGPAS